MVVIPLQRPVLYETTVPQVVTAVAVIRRPTAQVVLVTLGPTVAPILPFLRASRVTLISVTPRVAILLVPKGQVVPAEILLSTQPFQTFVEV